METVVRQERQGDTARLVAKLPSRVIGALDHFSVEERAAVRAVVEAFASDRIAGTRLPDPDPFYLLRATPAVLVIVRRDDRAPITVEAVAPQEKWDYLAHAG